MIAVVKWNKCKYSPTLRIIKSLQLRLCQQETFISLRVELLREKISKVSDIHVKFRSAIKKYFRKGAKNVAVCAVKSERENLIKTFPIRFIWTLTRHLLTRRRQGIWLFDVTILETEHISSVLFASTCTCREIIIYANIKLMLLILNLSLGFSILLLFFLRHWW